MLGVKLAYLRVHDKQILTDLGICAGQLIDLAETILMV